MRNLFPLLLFMVGCSLMAPKSSNAIESLAEEVIKKKEGIQITLEPIEEAKHK